MPWPLISAPISTHCTPSGLLTDWKIGVSPFDFWVYICKPAPYSILNFISLRRLHRHIVIRVLMASTSASRCCLKALCGSEGELWLLYVCTPEKACLTSFLAVSFSCINYIVPAVAKCLFTQNGKGTSAHESVCLYISFFTFFFFFFSNDFICYN